jgi:anti-sigma B factor antagonist
VPQADPELAVTLQSHPAGPCLLAVGGELDYHTAPRLRAGLDQVPMQAVTGLVIDLSALTYCDSTGISVLVSAYHLAKAAGVELALAGINPDIARVFRVIGLDQVFSSYDSVDAAARALSS